MESKDAACDEVLKRGVKKLQTDASHALMIVEATQHVGRIREAMLSSKPILKKDGLYVLGVHMRPIIDEFNERSRHIGNIFDRMPYPIMPSLV